MKWKQPKALPLLGMKPDTRSRRWREAEARCGPGFCDPADLAIIAEEQAAWDAARPYKTRT